MRRGLMYSILPVSVIAVNELVAMDAVKGKDDHYDEIGNQQRGVKRVPVVQVFEGLIRIVGSEIMLQPMLRRSQPPAPTTIDHGCKR